jgi:hypothetical protein
MSNEMYTQRIENALSALASDVHMIAIDIRQIVAQNGQTQKVLRDLPRIISEAFPDKIAVMPSPTQPPAPPTVDWVPIEQAVLEKRTPIYIRLANGVIASGSADVDLDIDVYIDKEYMLFSRYKKYAEANGEVSPITHVAKVTLPRGPEVSNAD